MTTPTGKSKRKTLLAFSVATLAIASNVQAFDPDIHEAITESELRAVGFDVDSADEVGDSNYYTDYAESSNEAAHADNNNLGGASQRLREKRTAIGDALAVCNRRSALDTMGEALHTVQDIFSHSNSVDNGIPVNDLLRLQNGTARCQSPEFAPGGLVTGYFSVSGWFQGDQCKGMPDGMCCHLDLNKDNTEKLNGARHGAAVNAARAGTRDYNALLEQDIRTRFPGARAEHMLKQLQRNQRTTFFVIDDTGSMGQDLSGVKATVNAYIDSLITGDEAPSLGLVTFKDNVTDYGIVCDIDTLRARINALRASGGGDCPEVSNSGLIAALSHFPQVVQDLQITGGRVLLATDASARDANLGTQVVSNARFARASIDAILTGDCAPEGSSVSTPVSLSDNQDGPASNIAAIEPAASTGDPLTSRSARTQLRAITEQTGGVLFNVNRGEVRDVSNVLLELGRPDVTVVLSQKLESGNPVEVELPVDDTLTAKVTFMVTASTSAALPAVSFRRPNGSILSADDVGVTYRRLSSVLRYEVSNPEIGVWTAVFAGDGSGVLRAYGASTLRLDSVRLMGEGGGALDHATALRPIESEPVIGEILAARLRFTEGPQSLTVSLKTPTGNVLSALPPPSALSERQFLAELTVPSQAFVVETSGVTTLGNRFIRQVSVPAVPQSVDIRFDPNAALVTSGADSRLTFALHNVGPNEALYRLSASIDKSWPIVTPSEVVVPAGERRTLQLTVTVPADAADNEHAVVRVNVQDVNSPQTRNNARTDLVVTSNRPPVCSAATADPNNLWPPNHQWMPVTIQGVTDPDGDAIRIETTAVSQDEPVTSSGSGNTAPDAAGLGTSQPMLRAERNGNGDGRVYRVSFKAGDGKGGECSGSVFVATPKSNGREAVDSGQAYNSIGE